MNFFKVINVMDEKLLSAENGVLCYLRKWQNVKFDQKIFLVRNDKFYVNLMKEVQ